MKISRILFFFADFLITEINIFDRLDSQKDFLQPFGESFRREGCKTVRISTDTEMNACLSADIEKSVRKFGETQKRGGMKLPATLRTFTLFKNIAKLVVRQCGKSCRFLLIVEKFHFTRRKRMRYIVRSIRFKKCVENL